MADEPTATVDDAQPADDGTQTTTQQVVDPESYLKLLWLIENHGIEKGADPAVETAFMTLNPQFDAEADDANEAERFIYRPSTPVATEPSTTDAQPATGVEGKLDTLIDLMTKQVSKPVAQPFGMTTKEVPAPSKTADVSGPTLTKDTTLASIGDGDVNDAVKLMLGSK